MDEPMGLKFVDLSKVTPEPAAIESVPEHIAKRYNILPLRRDSISSPNRLMVAISDVKTGAVGLDAVKFVSRCKITSVLATKLEIEAAIVRAYTSSPEAGDSSSLTSP